MLNTSMLNYFIFEFDIFREGHKVLRNLHRRFDRYYIGQIYGGDFAKLCGLLRIYELYDQKTLVKGIQDKNSVHNLSLTIYSLVFAVDNSDYLRCPLECFLQIYVEIHFLQILSANNLTTTYLSILFN